MNAFVIAAFCAVLGVTNAGLIGSGLVSPLGVRSGLIDNSGLIGSSLISPLGVRSGLIDNSGLGLVAPGLIGARTIATGISAPAVGSTVVSGPSGTIVDNRNLGLSSGIIGAGLINNDGLGLVSAPGVIAARSLAGGAILGNNGLVLNSGLGLINSGIWNGAPALVARSGLIANQLW